jgi:hypothetical protein
MELQILSQSISALQTLKDVMDENKLLKSQLFDLQQNFAEYKTKTKISMKTMHNSYNKSLCSKQAEIEKLSMVSQI